MHAPATEPQRLQKEKQGPFHVKRALLMTQKT